MLSIGLSGGIGAGKSTVAQEFARLGAVVIDADQLSREVVEPGTDGLAALVARFGDGILQADGSLDRAALAAIAFNDDAARADLNAIVHPLVGARTQQIMDDAGPEAVVLQDLPLLVENGLAPLFHLVAIVWVPTGERVRRLVESRGMDADDALARITAQAGDEERRAIADIWLENVGAQADLAELSRQLWATRIAPYRDNILAGRVAEVRDAVLPPNPYWRSQAERLAARLRLLGGHRVLRVDHVGSTAVPELPARDVLDFQLTVDSMERAAELAPILADGGFPLIAADEVDDLAPSSIGGETDPGVYRQAVHGSADPGRAARIAIRVAGHPGQRFALLLRDWLRDDRKARAEFTAWKTHAVPDVYATAKRAWFTAAEADAEAWAARTGWSPEQD